MKKNEEIIELLEKLTGSKELQDKLDEMEARLARLERWKETQSLIPAHLRGKAIWKIKEAQEYLGVNGNIMADLFAQKFLVKVAVDQISNRGIGVLAKDVIAYADGLPEVYRSNPIKSNSGRPKKVRAVA